jgi:gamma-glutamyltranspeptidase/glutathione hydrolase
MDALPRYLGLGLKVIVVATLALESVARSAGPTMPAVVPAVAPRPAAAPVAVAPVARAAPSAPLRVGHAAVASDHPLASAAGVAALKAGGNAVDAACATALALGVVHPESSGIGGGGFAVVYLAKAKETHALDFRERAPASVTPAMYLKDGKAQPALSMRGGLAVAVPGEVRGLGEMVRRWGKLPFRRCVEPALALASHGFPVSWRLARDLGAVVDDAGKHTAGDPAVDQAFVAQIAGTRRAEGETWKRSELAATLQKLKSGGPDAFYKGQIAADIVTAVKAAGGVMTVADLGGYTVVERKPVATAYRGLTIYSMPPASSGGVALIETLGILGARFPVAADLPPDGRSGPAYLHVLVEAFKHGFADRARFLGDTDFVPVDIAHLTDPAYHRALAARINPAGVLPHDAYGTPAPPRAPPRDGGTTHFNVIDADGNAVALTSTINLSFGAHLIAGKSGIVLNDQMDDFSLQPGVPNAFGLIGNEQNAIAPGKRPLSSMTPTIAVDHDGRVRIAVGAAGGPTIITATAQVLLNVVDGKMDAQAAIAAPRLHHQWTPDALMVEPELPVATVRALEQRGQKVKPVPHIGTVNLLVRTDTGIEAASEPRSPSAPAGY